MGLSPKTSDFNESSPVHSELGGTLFLSLLHRSVALVVCFLRSSTYAQLFSSHT